MKLLLTLLVALLPMLAFAAEPLPELDIPDGEKLLAERYYEIKETEAKYRKAFVESNKKLLEAVMAQRPCVPTSVLEKSELLGEAFPAKEFKKAYIAKILTKLDAADITALNDFYQTHIGKLFIRWANENTSEQSSMVPPIEDKMDAELYTLYMEFVEKEYQALLILSTEGPLLPEDVLKASDEAVNRGVETLVSPYLDKQGNCPE